LRFETTRVGSTDHEGGEHGQALTVLERESGLRVWGLRPRGWGALSGSPPARPACIARKSEGQREIGNLLPNNRRQRRTCYALCPILYPVSAAHTSIFRMDSNSTSYTCIARRSEGQENVQDAKRRGQEDQEDEGGP